MLAYYSDETGELKKVFAGMVGAKYGFGLKAGVDYKLNKRGKPVAVKD